MSEPPELDTAVPIELGEGESLLETHVSDAHLFLTTDRLIRYEQGGSKDDVVSVFFDKIDRIETRHTKNASNNTLQSVGAGVLAGVSVLALVGSSPFATTLELAVLGSSVFAGLVIGMRLLLDSVDPESPYTQISVYTVAGEELSWQGATASTFPQTIIDTVNTPSPSTSLADRSR